MDTDEVVDLEHVEVTSGSQHNVTTQQTPEEMGRVKMKKRRRTIFTRVLLVAFVAMFVSMGAMAFGVYLLNRETDSSHPAVPAIIVLSMGGMAFLLTCCPICTYTEGKKSFGEPKDMTKLFHCCRILTMVWAGFTLCAIILAIVFHALAVLLDDYLDVGMFVHYIIIAIGCVILVLTLLIICPICCCDKVYGYTRYQRRRYWYMHQSGTESGAEPMEGEEHTREVSDTDRRSRPRPSAPPHEDLRYSRRNNQRPPRHHRDRDENDVRDDDGHDHHRDRGRGRRRGRGRPRVDRERRGESGATNENIHDRGRGRVRPRGRYERERRRPGHADRNKENETKFEDAPPSYEEVMEQKAQEN